MNQQAQISRRRNEDNCLPGFQLIVVDVDDSVTVETAMLLMDEYAYHLHTTKRHTDKQHRFRMIFPMSHSLKLDAKDYRDFMNNVYDWLPFEVDRQTNQRSRKWLTNDQPAFHEMHTGIPIDVLPFIPKTKKSEEEKKINIKLKNLNSVEKWFVKNTEEGNRSNMLIRYALMLVSDGRKFDDVSEKVLNLNSKLDPPMEEVEVYATILASTQKAILKRDSTL